MSWDMSFDPIMSVVCSHPHMPSAQLSHLYVAFPVSSQFSFFSLFNVQGVFSIICIKKLYYLNLSQVLSAKNEKARVHLYEG